MRTRRFFLILIPLALIIVIGAGVFFITRPPDYLSWLDDPTLTGSCEAAALLEYVDARLHTGETFTSLDAIRLAAQTAIAEYLPDFDPTAVRYSDPVVITASLPGTDARSYHLIYAETKAFNAESGELGTAAVMLIDDIHNQVYPFIIAASVQSPIETCLRDR